MFHIINCILNKISAKLSDSICNRLYMRQDQFLRKVARLNTISMLHKNTFEKYKGIYLGKDVVLIGAGPSVSKFIPIDNCIYVGLNRACKLKNIKFDYLFTIDKLGIDKIYPEFASVDCTKFVGDQNNGIEFQIPESEIAKFGNVRRYKTDVGLYSSSQFTLDIESQPIGNFNSVSLQAMQFILYTNPKNVYIVGIDCSTLGHFDASQNTKSEHHEKMKSRGENVDKWASDTTAAWNGLKRFAEIYYPDTKIISVNPVGLRGLFFDLDQEQ